MSSCGCGGLKAKNTLIYSCSGAANVAEIADRVARRLAREGAASMFCLAGLGAGLKGMIETAQKADLNLVIDGCSVDCARNIFQNANLTNTQIIRVTDLGIEKTKGVPVSDEQIEKVYAAVKATLVGQEG